MQQWRISKYNPKLRDASGNYLANEWVTFQEIGEVFNGETFTVDEYLMMEKIYIKAAMLIALYSDIKSFKITDYNNIKYQPLGIELLGSYIDVDIKNNSYISAIELPNIIRMMLREIIGCKIVYKDSFYIHVGWDFYMYVGSEYKLDEALNEIKTLGLYIEKHDSPYR